MKAFADDTESAKRLKSGDLRAFAEMVRKYQDKIYFIQDPPAMTVAPDCMKAESFFASVVSPTG